MDSDEIVETVPVPNCNPAWLDLGDDTPPRWAHPSGEVDGQSTRLY